MDLEQQVMSRLQVDAQVLDALRQRYYDRARGTYERQHPQVAVFPLLVALLVAFGCMIVFAVTSAYQHRIPAAIHSLGCVAGAVVVLLLPLCVIVAVRRSIAWRRRRWGPWARKAESKLQRRFEKIVKLPHPSVVGHAAASLESALAEALKLSAKPGQKLTCFPELLWKHGALWKAWRRDGLLRGSGIFRSIEAAVGKSGPLAEKLASSLNRINNMVATENNKLDALHKQAMVRHEHRIGACSRCTGKRPAWVTKRVPCHHCEGKGYRVEHSALKGEGEKPAGDQQGAGPGPLPLVSRTRPVEPTFIVQKNCDECAATGKLVVPADDLCPDCGIGLEEVLAAPWVKERESKVISVITDLCGQVMSEFAEWLTGQPWYEETVRLGQTPKKYLIAGEGAV